MNVSSCGEVFFPVTEGPKPGVQLAHKDTPYNSVNDKGAKTVLCNNGGEVPYVCAERTPAADEYKPAGKKHDTCNDGYGNFRAGDVKVTPAVICNDGGVPYAIVPLGDVPAADNQHLHFFA